MAEGKCRWCGASLAFMGARHEIECRLAPPASDPRWAISAKPRLVEKIEEGLKEVLAIAKGEAKPAKTVEPKTLRAPVKTVEESKPKRPDRKPTSRAKTRPLTVRDAPRGDWLPDKVAAAPAQPEPKSEAICQPAGEPVIGSRSKKWRDANRDKSREYMRGYMKDRRSKSSEARRREMYEALRVEFEGK